MSTLNRATIIGRLGADPELRQTQSGTAVCNMRVATNDRDDDTSWHSVVCFAGLAETCAEYLSQGRRVCVEGRIQYDEWEDRDGNTRTTTEIVASDVTFLGGSSGGSGSSEVRSGEGEEYSDESFSDSEIPF